jgi:Ca2+-binding EF-hand superfamily protein
VFITLDAQASSAMHEGLCLHSVPAGERGHSQDSHAAQQQLLHFFDRDGSGTIDFNEFVLIVICLSVPEKDIEVVFDVMDLVREMTK